jgi:[histone H3]-lysine36 N-dimethyltransferase SETMAR
MYIEDVTGDSLREHIPSGKACLRVNIDATRVGNVARFIIQ